MMKERTAPSIEREALKTRIEDLERRMRLRRSAGRRRGKRQTPETADLEQSRRRLFELEEADELWRAAETRLSQAAAGLRVNRRSALLAFPALCRREGIEVRFSGTPATNGRTIWLGPVDFASPLAPVYVWGHGLHERGHVRYTDFDALRGAGEAVRAVANVLEDVRVDALTLADYAGYGMWREALLAVLFRSGRASIARGGIESAPQTLVCARLHAELMRRVLGLDVPERHFRRLDDACRTRFGEEASRAIVDLVLSRQPLGSTEDAVRLARDVISTAEREAERLGEPQAAASAPRPSYEPQLSLFDERGEPTPDSETRWDDPGMRARALLEIGARPEASSDAEGLAHLANLAAGWDGLSRDPSETDALRESRFERLLSDSERLASGGRVGSDAAERYGARASADAYAAFRALYPKTAGFAMGLADALRGRTPSRGALADSGWDFADDAVDAAACGETRVFERDVPLVKRSAAVQILLDLSGSTAGEPAAVLKCAAARLESALKGIPGVAARTAIFPDEEVRGAAPVTDWSTPAHALARVVGPIPGSGPTPLKNALFWAGLGLIERDEAKKIVFIVTDAPGAGSRAVREIDALRSVGIEPVMLVAGDRPTGDAALWRRILCAHAPSASDVPLAMRELLAKLARRGAFGS